MASASQIDPRLQYPAPQPPQQQQQQPYNPGPPLQARLPRIQQAHETPIAAQPYYRLPPTPLAQSSPVSPLEPKTAGSYAASAVQENLDDQYDASPGPG